MPVMDRFRASRLVFAGVHEPSPKAVSIEGLSRVREPVSRSKSGVQGKVADALHGRSRHAESQNEIKAFRVLAATARADEWQEQPFFMEFHRDGKRHRYTPDVLVVWGSHSEVVEIKEDREAELAETEERFAPPNTRSATEAPGSPNPLHKPEVATICCSSSCRHVTVLPMV